MGSMQDVVVVGCGGIGGWLMAPLCAEMAADGEPHSLTLVDGDTVEKSNLGRQNFLQGDVGAAKVHVCEAIARQFLPKSVKIVTVFDYLGPDNIGDVVGVEKLVLAGPDNHPVRALLFDYAASWGRSINLVVGGNEASDGNVMSSIFGQPCTVKKRHPEIWSADPKTDKAKMSCAELAALPGGGQTLAANMMAAALMMSMVTAINDFRVGRIPSEEVPEEIYFDLKGGPKVRSVKR